MKLTASILLLAAVLPGQARLFSHLPETPGDGLGRALSFLGDVDGDGVPDLAIGGKGYVQVRSGSHGGLLFRLGMPTKAKDFGHAVLGPGDLDGDGRADLLVASPEGGTHGEGSVTLYSGKTHNQIYELRGEGRGDRFGFAIAALGDLDGDGTGDFGVGSPGHDNIAIDAGIVRIYSGKTGRQIFYYTGVLTGGGFGSALTSIGDLDLDGVDDILIGAAAGCYTRIYSAKKATLLRMTQGTQGTAFGSHLLGTGDLDGDKVLDYWIASPLESLTGKGEGVLRLYSGKDGKVLQTLSAPEALSSLGSLTAGSGASSFGWHLAPAGDVDGDGHDDLLVADPFASGTLANAGRVQLFSGKTRQILATWTGTSSADFLGNRILGGTDFDGDAVPDVVTSSLGSGKVHLFAGKGGQVIQTLSGSVQDGFGASLLAYQDQDQDGRPDLLIASPWQDGFRGKVELVSSRTGKILRTWSGANKGDSFGTGLALAPDRDADGIPELIVSSPTHAGSRGSVVILASRTGKVLVTMIGGLAGDLFGEQVLCPGDLDSDGIADVLVGAPGAQAANGALEARSGSDGKRIYQVTGVVVGGRMGSSLALLQDLDGDAIPEYLVGAPTDTSAKVPGPGSFSIHSGIDGRRLVESRSTIVGRALGSALACAGDMDGDGRPDFAVASLGGTGSVEVFHAENPESGFGTSLRALPDQDQDGLPEILVGLPARGSIRIHAGKGGTLLDTITPAEPIPGFGRCLDLADINRDEAADLAVGSDGAGVRIYSLQTPSLLATPNSWPIEKGGLQTFTLSAGAVHAGKIYMVLGTLSGVSPGVRVGTLDIPLNPDFYTTFSLAWPNQAPLIASHGYLDLTGEAKAGLLLPPLAASLKGLVFHHAYLVLGFSLRFEFASNPVPLLLR